MYGTTVITCGLTAILLRRVAPKLHLDSERRIPVSTGVVFLFVYLPFALWMWQPKYAVLGLVTIAMWMLGLLDDLKELSVWTRLKIESILAVILIISGWQLHWFGYAYLDLALTFLWIVGITNAFNILDNADGLCAGVTLIACLFLGAITGNVAVYALAGIVLAFWVLNFPPAMMFMGDCGSLFIGVNMACLAMEIKVVAPLLLVAPIADTTFVVVRRIIEKRSPFQGGRDHLSHELGRWTLPTYYVVGLVGGILAWLIS